MMNGLLAPSISSEQAPTDSETASVSAIDEETSNNEDGARKRIKTENEQDDEQGQSSVVVEHSFTTHFDRLLLGPEEYALPVPMNESQIEYNSQIILQHSSDISRFCGLSDSNEIGNDELLVNTMKQVIQNTAGVATHPYIILDHLCPRNLSDKNESLYVTESSEKFKYVAAILKAIRPYHSKIALVGKAGKTIDLLGSLLRGQHIKYKRYGDRKNDDKESSTNSKMKAKFIVSLISSDAGPDSYMGDPVDAIIAVDHYVDPWSPLFTKIRNHKDDPSRPLAPLIRLVAINSTEHILMSQAMTATSDDMTVSLLGNAVAAAVALRRSAGILPSHFQSVNTNVLANRLADWINSGGLWPFPDLPDIAEYDRLKMEGDDKKVNGYLRLAGKALKRSYNEKGLLIEDQSLSRPVKRHKAKDGIISDIRSSISRPLDISFLISLDKGSAPELDNVLTEDVLAKELQQTKLQLIDNQKLIKRQQVQVDDLRSHLGKQLNINEQLTAEMSDIVLKASKVEILEKEIETSRKRIIADRDKYQEQNEELKIKIRQLNEIITQQDNISPDVLKWHELSEKIDEMTKEANRAKERVDARTKENEYMREQYQKASEKAMETASENDKLKQINQELKRKADSQIERLHQINIQDIICAKDDKIKQLTLQIQMINDQLRRTNDVDAMRQSKSRYGVRSSSVPRRTNSPSLSISKSKELNHESSSMNSSPLVQSDANNLQISSPVIDGIPTSVAIVNGIYADANTTSNGNGSSAHPLSNVTAFR